jgi:hypothetical protein
MAIRTGFAREERCREIDDCPLSASEEANENACLTCSFNAAWRGQAKVGCVITTTLVLYQRTMHQLEATAREDYRRLTQILAEERRGATNMIDDQNRLRELQRIFSSWRSRVGNEPEIAPLLRTVSAFIDAAITMREPIVLLA